MANARFSACILSLKLATILKKYISVSALLQPIEQANFKRIGVVLLTF